MKIHSIYLHRAGPIDDRTIDLTNAWNRGVHDRILFSGPNGSGKSTILRAIANLWSMMGQWLATPEIKPEGDSEFRSWLQSHTEAVGIILESIPGLDEKVGVYFGSNEKFTAIRSQAIYWMGELHDPRKHSNSNGGSSSSSQEEPDEIQSSLIHDQDHEWMRSWSSAYNMLRLSVDFAEENPFRSPNVIYLEAEDRRWVRPEGNPKQLIPDDPTRAWLVTYQASPDWKGQIEASLLTLKALDEKRFLEVLADLNKFLVGKKIRSKPTTSLRLMVDINSDNGKTISHPLDELSAGERQVLIQLYLISRWLQPGGVVLLDEPDLHLHPSLIPMLLGRVEAIVAERQSQLFLTSHLPELWFRYETGALRIELGGKQ